MLVETKALAGERGCLPARQTGRRRSRSRRRCRPFWPPASTGSLPRTSACSRPPRSSGTDVSVRAAPGHRRERRRGAARRARADSRPRSFCTRRVSSRNSSTRSSMHSPTRWPTEGSAPGAAPRAARRDRRCDRDAAPGSSRRARRAAGPPRLPRRAGGKAVALSAAGRSQGRRTFRIARGSSMIRAGVARPQALPEDRSTMNKPSTLRLELRPVLIPLGRRPARPGHSQRSREAGRASE